MLISMFRFEVFFFFSSSFSVVVLLLALFLVFVYVHSIISAEPDSLSLFLALYRSMCVCVYVLSPKTLFRARRRKTHLEYRIFYFRWCVHTENKFNWAKNTYYEATVPSSM